MHSVSTIATVPARLSAFVAGLAACLLACAFLLTAPAAGAAPAAAAAAADEPHAWVTAGSLAPCDTETCRYWVVHWENLGDGEHQVACWAGATPEVPVWHDIETHATTWAESVKYTIEGDSGSAQLPCYMGRSYNGTAVGVKTPGALHTGSTWNV